MSLATNKLPTSNQPAINNWLQTSFQPAINQLSTTGYKQASNQQSTSYQQLATNKLPTSNQPAINKMTTDDIHECTCTLKAFANGGSPGLSHLRNVLQNIFKTYNINSMHTQIQILDKVKIPHVIQDNQICIVIPDYDV
jgi:hypothetical protein